MVAFTTKYKKTLEGVADSPGLRSSREVVTYNINNQKGELMKSEIVYSTFESVASKNIKECRSSWEDFCKMLQNPPEADKKEDLPLLKLASFKNKELTPELRRKGFKSPRCNENVGFVTGIECDYDAGRIGVLKVVEFAESLKVHFVVYTTPSDTVRYPRWRLLLPFSGALAPEVRAFYVSKIDKAFGGDVFASESWGLSQAFYYGCLRRSDYFERDSIAFGFTKFIDELFPYDPNWKPRKESLEEELEPVPLSANEREKLISALSAISAEDYQTWTKVGLILKLFGDEGRELWFNWSSESVKWDTEQGEQKWESFRPNGGLSIGTIYHLAKENGWAPDREQNPQIKNESTFLPEDYLRTDKGAIRPLNSNMLYWILKNPEYENLQYDEFTDRVLLGSKSLAEGFYRKLALQMELSLQIPCTEKKVLEPVRTLAETRRIHSLLDMIGQTEWDGVERGDRFFSRYYHLEDTPYHRAAARVMFLSALWRLMEPGCQADQMVLLVGPPGIGKSYGIHELFYHDRGYVLEKIADLHHKDAQSNLRGKWVLEMSEMDAARRAEMETLLSFITRREEHFRKAYGIDEITWRRQCIIVGTSNDYELFSELDNNRRLLPLLMTPKGARLDEIREDRDQLWAEYFFRALQGEAHPYLTQEGFPDLAVARGAISHGDAFREAIEQYIEQKVEVTTTEIAQEALYQPLERINKGMQRRIATILRRCGFTKEIQTGKDGARRYVFKRGQEGLPW